MTAALLAPAGLIALAALALPLLIHLARRTEQRPTEFAALRWLRPKPRPRRRPRLDERVLLAARLLLLAVLALGLAHPVLRGAPAAQRWLAAVPGVDAATARALAGRDVSARWLAPGFPDLRRPAPTGAAPFPSLLRELDADLPAGATLTVLAPALLQGADAERPRLSRRVDWRVLPGAMAERRPLPTADPVLVVRYLPQHEADSHYLRAAVSAWARPGSAPAIDAAPSSQGLPTGARWIAWLAPGRPPADLLRRADEGAVVLLSADAGTQGLSSPVPLWRDASGLPLAEGGALGGGRWRRFTRPLAPEAMPELLEPDFPSRLHALLAEPPPAPARVEARDYAPLSGAPPGRPAAEDLRAALALAAVALLGLERWLATQRRRAATP